MFEFAILSGKDGTFTIDLDVIADEIASGAARPDFYYSEESQQNKFTCAACSEWNDILGRYAYCSTCGTRNELPEISEELEKVRVRVNAGEDLGTCVRDTVALFDVAARQYVGQLVRRVPLTKARRARLEGKIFHDLKGRADDLNVVFGIDF